MSNTIQRKIFFFRININQNGKSISPLNVFSKIGSMPCSYGGRLIKIDDSRDRHMKLDSDDYPIKVQISNYKKHDWPTGAIMDNRIPLIIPDGGSICESTHFIVFNDGIIGMEYNQSAPRQGGVVNFINQIFPDYEVVVETLVNKELGESLIRADNSGIKLFRMRIRRGSEEIIKALHDQLGMTLSALENVDSNAPDYEIVLRPSRGNKLKLSFLSKIVEWLKEDDTREAIIKGRIKVFDLEYKYENVPETLDVLQPYIMARKRIVKEDNDTKAVNSQSMYDAISDSYIELKEIISLSLQ